MAVETPRYRVDRPIYSFEDLSKDYIENDLNFNLLQKLNYERKIRKITMLSVVRYVFPFPFIMASFYSAKLILYDLIAGLTMLVFNIPQGMAYGLLAGLQPINGLYASFFPPLIYIIFGSSRHLSIGTFSIISLLSSVPAIREANNPRVYDILKVSLNGTTDIEAIKLGVSVATTLLAGIIQLIMGFFQLGCIVNYVNDALISGFTTATGVHIIVSQIGHLLGYSVKRYTGPGELPYTLFLYAKSIMKINWVTFGISSTCLLLLLLFTEVINPLFRKKVFDIPLPIQLIIIIIGTVMSRYGSFHSNYSVNIVGDVPRGFPYPTIPEVKVWQHIAVDAVLLAIFGFMTSSALVKIYASQFKYEVNYNQELVAYGLSNIFGSFFKCVMSAGALARSSVIVEVGMKSQLASLISCVLMVGILLYIGPLFAHLPDCVLAAIIVIALKSIIMQAKTVPELFRVSKFDFDIWIVSFGATILLNVPYGLVVGFIFSLLIIFIRFHNPKSQLLGQLPQTNIYKNVKAYKDAIEIPGIKIFRYDAPIFFANADHFREKLYKKCGVDPRQLTELTDISRIELPPESEKTPLIIEESDIKMIKFKPSVKFIIVDFSSINYVDNVSIKVLDNIYQSCKEFGVFVFFAEPNQRIRKMLVKAEFAGTNLNRMMFITIHDAVLRVLSIMMTLENL